MRNCKRCQKEFEPQTKVQTYCHEPCYARIDPRDAFLNRKPPRKPHINSRRELTLSQNTEASKL